MTKSDAITTIDTSPEDSVKNDKKKKSILPKLFSSKWNGKRELESDGDGDGDGDDTSLDEENKIESKEKTILEPSPVLKKSFSERQTSPEIEGLNLSNFDQPMVSETEIREFRIFVATWNVGGKTPHNGLNLEDFLLVEGSADIYVCGFQEIVPLNAGNVLVIEDNEPAAKWLTLISHSLNKPSVPSSSESVAGIKSPPKELKSPSSHNFFQKPSLKVLSKSFRADSRILKTCNCPIRDDDLPGPGRRRYRKLSDPFSSVERKSLQDSVLEDLVGDVPPSPWTPGSMGYRLIASKQMVGLFISVWARKELIPHIAHLRIDSVGRGIMGYLGNKGCISISMSLHQTSFCFVCSHLASGEKEGDELKRNSDVIEILKNSQFPKLCKNPKTLAPEKIIDHDRVIWFGDLNYRVALSYEETRLLLEDNDWDSMLKKDQLNIEREAGRVFSGFKEGRILFAPTYKYTHNSDSYAGETAKTKKKRRTPAWCDRILWSGKGIEQLSYTRGESRFSDHRPVCAVFAVEVEVRNKIKSKFRKGYSCAISRLEYEECMPQRHSFY